MIVGLIFYACVTLFPMSPSPTPQNPELNKEKENSKEKNTVIFASVRGALLPYSVKWLRHRRQ